MLSACVSTLPRLLTHQLNMAEVQSKMKVRIVSRSGREMMQVDGLEEGSTVLDVKRAINSHFSKYYVARQQLKLGTDKKDKALKDEATLGSLGVKEGTVLYFKDLGPQISWRTVFMIEYAGPLVVYLLFYPRQYDYYSPINYIYPGDRGLRHDVVHMAAFMWSLHYTKRLLETALVHRFSHATMPLRNLFKNSLYYWGFAAYVAYFVNHPLYTPPTYGWPQIIAGATLFLICEYGNYAIHIALRDLRPPGTKQRKIPFPTRNPMTKLFDYVSCPNYTYEFGAWIGFTVMTQCLPALLFTMAGFFQMAIWALAKHKNYKKEFEKYPRRRRAILPFLL